MNICGPDMKYQVFYRCRLCDEVFVAGEVEEVKVILDMSNPIIGLTRVVLHYCKVGDIGVADVIGGKLVKANLP